MGHQQQEHLMRGLRTVEHPAGILVSEALSDPGILEILLNQDGRLWVEYVRGGIVPIGELSEIAAMSLIATIAAALDRVATPDSPIVEGDLSSPKGRFVAVIPPVATRPLFRIQKYSEEVAELADFLKQGVLEERHYRAIDRAVGAQANIVISGGSGSGKTTLARAMLRHISLRYPGHRIVIIEDTPELNHVGENIVSLKVSPGGTVQQLLQVATGLRAGRLVVGEVRGSEALSLLKMWNTCSPGGLATIHAHSAHAALVRFEQLVGEVAASPLPQVIGDAIDLVVHIERSPDEGVPRVVEVLSVAGYREGTYHVTEL